MWQMAIVTNDKKNIQIIDKIIITIIEMNSEIQITNNKL